MPPSTLPPIPEVSPPASVGGRDCVDLSIVIPAYNEARRLGGRLDEIERFIACRDRRVDVHVVDDGSQDGTTEVVRRRPRGSYALHLHELDRHRGKGAAVRRGMLEAAGRMILLTDADQSTPIEETLRLATAIDRGADVAIGSRHVAGARLDPAQPFGRKLAGTIFRWTRRCLALHGVRDTQCGFKLFTREAAQRVFPRCREEGYAIDIEALLLARSMRFTLSEIGVTWRNDTDSRVRTCVDGLSLAWATVRLARKISRIPQPAPRRSNATAAEQPASTSTTAPR